jgi:hypothetical protein
VPDRAVNVLLSRALISLTRAYERTDPDAPTLPFYADLLRVLDDEGIGLREIPARARISKRVVTTLVNSSEKAGLLTNETKVVRLTDAGTLARAAGEKTLAAAEAAWTSSVGESKAMKLRAALETVVAQMALEHPHYMCCGLNQSAQQLRHFL